MIRARLEGLAKLVCEQANFLDPRICRIDACEPLGLHAIYLVDTLERQDSEKFPCRFFRRGPTACSMLKGCGQVSDDLSSLIPRK